MTDEAVPPADPPKAATPPPHDPSPDGPPPPSSTPPTSSAPPSPPPYNPPPYNPPPYAPPAAGPPPWFGSGFGPGGVRFSRDQLVRPQEGRYLAGVCAAAGRATNTDPVLWRVIIAVLAIFGIGVVIYLVAWLAIPAEGDTASPLESALGRGNSGMSPVSVLLLGVAAALTFAFVVNSGMRAVLLAGAVLAGGFLLIRHNNANRPAGSGTTKPNPPFATPGYAPAGATAQAWQPQADTTAAGWQTRAGTATAGEPVTAPLPPMPPGPGVPPGAGVPPPAPGPSFGAQSFGAQPFGAQPAGEYRPPFAPHGPWSGATPYPPVGRPPRAPKPPKPPRERSRLGRITFFLIPVALGLVAFLDLTGVPVRTSTYFAAALTTVALGLVVGAWFGRARGLIALALLATVGLGVSSADEHWGGPLRDTTWRPTDISRVADRYETPLGNAILDLRAVDFTGQEQTTTVRIGGGRLQVLLPPRVDTVATVDLDHGRVRLFGNEWNGADLAQQEVTDLGNDGSGGGQLRLTLKMDAGDVEVTR